MGFTCHVDQMRDSSDAEVNEGVNEIRPEFGVFGGLPIKLLILSEHLFKTEVLPVYNLMPCMF